MATCPAHEVPRRVVERVLSRVVPGDGGCLLSTYHTANTGYAMVGFYEEGVQYNALCHRVVWAAKHGPIPEGMVVHHECFTRTCVNTEHMRLTERWQNGRRQGGQDWPEGTCKFGHDDRHMTYIESERKRRCAICYAEQRRERSRRATARRRERRLASKC